jgi:hypothetical protein
MDIEKNRLAALESIFSLIERQNPSTDEVAHVFELVFTALEELKSTFGDAITNITSDFNDFKDETIKKSSFTDDDVAEIRGKLNELIRKIGQVKAQKGDKGDKGDQGEPGKSVDADVVADIIKADELFVESIKGKDGEVANITPNEIRDSLEKLKDDERLDKSAIKGLDLVVDQAGLDRAFGILDQRTQFLLNKQGGTGSGTIGGTGTSPRMTYWTDTSTIAATANFSYQAPTVGGDSIVFNGADGAGKFTGANIAFNITSDLLVEDVPINIYSAALDTNIFYVDRTGTGYFRNRLGVGASAIDPSRTLHVYDSSLFGSAAPDASAFVDMVNFSGGPTYTLRLSGGTNPAMAMRSNATNNVTVKLQALDAGVGVFGTESAHPLSIYTSNSARMAVRPLGAMNFGSGATPYAEYDFELAGSTTRGNVGSNYGFRILSGGLNNIFVVKADTGNIGFTELNPASKLSVGGGASIGASYSATAAPTNGMIVQGNVGIGQTSASYSLDVLSAAALGIRIKTSGTSSYAQVRMEASGGTFGNMFKASPSYATYKNLVAGDFGIYNDGTGNMSFLNDNAAGSINFAAGSSSTAQMLLSSAGRLGIGVSSPSANLHLAAGTATANTAPLKFNSGTLLTTAEAGAVEFLTDTYYATVTTGAKRNAIATVNTGRSTAQTAAVASVLAYTLPAVDGSFEVGANVLVTTATSHSFTVTCAYTDEGNTSRTLTFNFTNTTGTLGTAISNTGGAVPYMGIPAVIRCKASTAITIATTGTFTTVTYNVEGFIKRLS